jgi:hypothetical protein
MEKIAQLSYSRIALTGVPSDSVDTNNPAWRVQGTSYSITQDGTQPFPLVYNGSPRYGGGTVSGGTVDPTPTHFTSGDVGGTIYRYVVWRNDPSCPEVTCPGSQDLKRVIVAIALDDTAAGGATRHYQELYKEISNPATSPDFDKPGAGLHRRRRLRHVHRTMHGDGLHGWGNQTPTVFRGPSGSPTPPAATAVGSRSPPTTCCTTRTASARAASGTRAAAASRAARPELRT